MFQFLNKFLVLGVLAISTTTQASTKDIAKEPEAVPGEYLVKLSDHINLKGVSVESLSEDLHSSIKTRIEDQNIVVIKRPVIEKQSSVMKSLKNNSLVKTIEPNYIYRINAVTANDPLLSKLWGIKNLGQQDAEGQAGLTGIDIGATEAWNIQTGSENVVVAVIDTGVKHNHEDLSANMWTNEAELTGETGVDDDGNGYIDDIHGYNAITNKGDPMDDHGHGTHCAGTIGARGNDGKGIVGVNWNVKIMGVKFLNKDGSGALEDAIKAIDYATKNGAKIMNNSWGGGAYSELLEEAIQRANSAGALFVAAAGNEANNNDSKPSYPATYKTDNVISVAAIDNRGQIATFSNYGKKTVHVAAPGVNIYSTTLKGYESWSGTSMAAPHVSGVAALLAAEFPDMSQVEIKKRIMETAKPVAGLRNKTSTRAIANAYSALRNERAPADLDDPSRWANKEFKVSSPHPYRESFKQSYTIKVDGAKEIAVYFEKFKTENKFDTVTLSDSNGKQFEVYSGNNDDMISSAVPGDSVTITIKSDSSESDYGFDVTKVYYR